MNEANFSLESVLRISQSYTTKYLRIWMKFKLVKYLATCWFHHVVYESSKKLEGGILKSGLYNVLVYLLI